MRNPPINTTIAAIVRSHHGSPELTEELAAAIGDDIDASVRDHLNEALHQPESICEPDLSPAPHVSGRRGHTEAEAAQRWCAFVREVAVPSKGKESRIGNRFLTEDGGDYCNPAGARCIGSHCMMWRWTDEKRGYCGLAGAFPPLFMPAGEPRPLTNRIPPPRAYDDEPTARDDTAKDLFGD